MRVGLIESNAIFIKVPFYDHKGKELIKIIEYLHSKNIKLNITAVFSKRQINKLSLILGGNTESIVSIFAGRIADTGIDPQKMISESLQILKNKPLSEIIWASPRELLNIFQAEQIGCHAITVTTGLIEKFKLIGFDLNEYSLDTVKMFYNDALNSGYTI